MVASNRKSGHCKLPTSRTQAGPIHPGRSVVQGMGMASHGLALLLLQNLAHPFSTSPRRSATLVLFQSPDSSRRPQLRSAPDVQLHVAPNSLGVLSIRMKYACAPRPPHVPVVAALSDSQGSRPKPKTQLHTLKIMAQAPALHPAPPPCSAWAGAFDAVPLPSPLPHMEPSHAP